MKKALTILLALVLCFGISACGGTTPQESIPAENETIPQATIAETTETKPLVYTYKAEPMQNAECTYYGPDANVPNSPDPSKVQGKIMVWTQCPNCGEENIGSHAIDPAELDFSLSDTIMHSDTDSCWDCSWDKDIDQFMWTIRITRIPE